MNKQFRMIVNCMTLTKTSGPCEFTPGDVAPVPLGAATVFVETVRDIVGPSISFGPGQTSLIHTPANFPFILSLNDHAKANEC